MKHIRILERRATWVALMLTLPLAPGIALVFPRWPVLPAFEKISENSRRHQAPKPGTIDATQQIVSALEGGRLSNESRNWLTMVAQNSDVMYLPVMQKVAQQLQAENPWVAEYAKVPANARLQISSLNPKDPAAAIDKANGLGGAAVSAGCLAKLSLDVRVASGATTEALREASITGRIYDPVSEVGYLSNGLISARQVAIFTMEPLITRSTEAELPAVMQTLDQLTFANIDPVLSLSDYFADFEDELSKSPMLKPLMPTIMTQRFLWNGGWYMVKDSQNFTRPENIGWADEVRAASGALSFPYGVNYYNNPLPGYTFLPSLPWTQRPALAARFRHAARTEANLLPTRMGRTRLFEGVSREMAALYAYGFLETQRHGENVYSKVRACETIRQAYKIACAARMYRADNDEWPKYVHELVPKYVESLPQDWSTSVSQDAALEILHPGKLPYGPLYLQRVDVNMINILRLLGLSAPVWDSENAFKWAVSGAITERDPGPKDSRAQGHLVFRRQSVTGPRDLSQLELYGLAERLRSFGSLKNVRVSPAPPDGLNTAFYSAAKRVPQFQKWLEDIGVHVPANFDARALDAGPVQVEADLDAPAEVLCILGLGPDQRDNHQPQLMLSVQVAGGAPQGDILVRAEPL